MDSSTSPFRHFFFKSEKLISEIWRLTRWTVWLEKTQFSGKGKNSCSQCLFACSLDYYWLWSRKHLIFECVMFLPATLDQAQILTNKMFNLKKHRLDFWFLRFFCRLGICFRENLTIFIRVELHNSNWDTILFIIFLDLDYSAFFLQAKMNQINLRV